MSSTSSAANTVMRDSPARPTSIEELAEMVGHELGPTPWHEVTQQVIDDFASVSGDRQWIHVDTDRAAEGPFGTTIAHGLFTLSLGPALQGELLDLTGFAQTINYGYDRVRFPSILRSGSRVAMRAVLRSVEDMGGTAHVVITQTFEVAGQDRPVCVAVAVARVVEHTS